MNECIACGADGFRFDTAKHIGLPDDPVEDSSMPNTFWTNVLSKLDNKDNLLSTVKFFRMAETGLQIILIHLELLPQVLTDIR